MRISHASCRCHDAPRVAQSSPSYRPSIPLAFLFQPAHRHPAARPPFPPAARGMASTAAIQEQLKVAEAQEAKARAEEVGLKAALGRCRAARAEWARAAHLLRLQLARTSRRGRLGLAVSRRPSPGTAPTTPAIAAAQPFRRPVGRPHIAGCFQCHFLARGGAERRRGGKAHIWGGRRLLSTGAGRGCMSLCGPRRSPATARRSRGRRRAPASPRRRRWSGSPARGADPLRCNSRGPGPFVRGFGGSIPSVPSVVECNETWGGWRVDLSFVIIISKASR